MPPVSTRQGRVLTIHDFNPQENTVKLRPLHDRIVAIRLDAEETTAGGIIIPDNAQEKPARGKVVAVGNGKRDDSGKRMALDVKEGDEILFGKYSGTEIEVGGQTQLVLREDDVLAVIG